MWPNRIILQAVGGVGWWPEIKERVDVDLVIEDAETPANHEVVLGLIGETQPRSKIIAVRRENGTDAVALDNQAFTWSEDRQVFVATMQRAKVFVPHPVIDAELLGPLPGILEVKVIGIYVYRALRITYSDRRGRYVTREVIGQRERIRSKTRTREQTSASSGW